MKQTRWIVVVIAYAAFIALGLFDGLLGVAWPSLRASFGQPVDALGLVLFALTTGHITASFANGRFIGRSGIAVVLITSSLLMGFGMLIQAIAPLWWLIVGGTFMLGLGMGMVDAGLNTYAAANFRARLLNWLHASFSVGTTVGAFWMTAVISAELSWRWGIGAVAAFHVVVLTAFITTRKNWVLRPANAQIEDESQTDTAAATGRETLKLPLVWFGIGLFMLYAAVEIGTGQWAFTLLTESRGIPEETAGYWTTLYWGSLTIGRILFGFIEANLKRLIRLAMAGLVVGAVILALNVSPMFSLAGLMIMGLAQAPIFPALIALTPGRVRERHAPNAIGYQVGAAGLGVAFLPGLAGVLADSYGLELIPWFMLGLSVVMLGLHEWMLRLEKPQLGEVVSPRPTGD